MVIRMDHGGKPKEAGIFGTASIVGGLDISHAVGGHGHDPLLLHRLSAGVGAGVWMGYPLGR